LAFRRRPDRRARLQAFRLGGQKLLFAGFGACDRLSKHISGRARPEKETILSKNSLSKHPPSKNSKDAMERAEASFKKEERAREGAKAMREYEADARAVHEKTARLKALRLAKEAADREAEPKKAGRQSKTTPTA
jgi:hypothetical protein